MSDADRRKLRVLVISLGRLGGVTKYGYLMSHALEEFCDVAAVTSTTADNREAWASFAGPHLEVDTFSSVLTMFASFFAFRRFMRIARFAREFEPDVIYYPGGHAYKPLLDLILATSAPVVLTVHDPELHVGENNLAQRLFAWANQRGCDGYVLLNRAQAGEFIKRQHLDAERVAVIPLGIFDDHVGDTVALGDIPGAEQLVTQAGNYLLFIGRIERYKGVGTLLDAYALLDPGKRIALAIAGAGAMDDHEKRLLDALAKDSVVTINRWLTETEVATLVTESRFVVVPYVHATQSAVIPLAYAHGTPVVASDAGGLPEQVVEGETGLSFHANDAASLARALSRALSLGDSERDAWGSKARDYAEANWSWEGVAGQLAEFLGSVRRR
jgi:glycosyltransferase involved in cell wall biosynthesis